MTRKIKIRSAIKLHDDEGNLIDKPRDAASQFNKYFSSIASNLKEEENKDAPNTVLKNALNFNLYLFNNSLPISAKIHEKSPNSVGNVLKVKFQYLPQICP